MAAVVGGVRQQPARVTCAVMHQPDLGRAAIAEDEINAFGLFSRVVVRPDRGDAVRAELEHRDGYSVSVFLPYTLTEDGPTYGELFAMAREPSTFPVG